MNAKLVFALMIAAIAAGTAANSAAQTSASYSIKAYTLNNGVDTMTSANFRMYSSLGDPLFTSPITSANYRLSPGLWYDLGGPTPVLLSAVSRKLHVGAGTFDLALSLVAPPAINHNPATEPRSGPAQTLVFQFDKPVISGNAVLSEGVATLGVPTFAGNEMTVPLTGVTNKQYVTVDVSSVAAADGGMGGSGSARIGLLVGNVTGSRQVLPSDVGLVRSHQLENVGPTNFLYSVTLGSKVLPADVGITRANQLQKLPTP
jgi:hypothetical protein